jgi:hypothetical protein
MLFRLSFAVGCEDVIDEESEGDGGDKLTYDMNKKDSQRQAR